MKIHELKCWEWSLNAVIQGIKKCELRLNDRDYQVGDVLKLNSMETKRCCLVVITHVFKVEDVIMDVKPGYVILSISKDGVKDHLAQITDLIMQEKLNALKEE